MAAPAQRMGRAWVSHGRTYGAWLLVLVLSVLLVSDLIGVWRITNHHDLDVFLHAARRLTVGEDIYADAKPFKAAIEAGTFSMKDNTVVWPYAYAPLIAILFVPATWLPEALVQTAWWGLNVGALLLGSWLCLRSMGTVTAWRLALGLALLWRFDPAIAGLRLGQIEIIQFLLLALTLYALSRNWDRRAGLALGLAAGLKFFPAALIALLIWRRRWRAAAWAAGTALVTIGGSFTLVGFQALPAYLDYTSIYGIGGAFAAFPLNQSLNGLISRNLVRNVFGATLKGLHLPFLAKTLVLVCDACIVLASAALTWQRTARPPDPDGAETQRFNLEFALAVAALLLVSPHSQVYTLVWALIPLSMLALWLTAQPRQVAWQWGALLLSYLLVGRNWVYFRAGLTRLVQSHYLFGVLGLWMLTGMALLQRRPAHSDRALQEEPVGV